MKQLGDAKWPSGRSRTIAYLGLNPDDLAKKYGLEFSRGVDDLDYYEQAVVELPSGRIVILVRYRGEQRAGTAVEVDAGDDPEDARRELLATISASADAFVWIE